MKGRGSEMDKKTIYEKYGKRPMDIIMALGVILLLSPVYLAVAGLVWIKFGSPVLFRQERIGLGEKVFTIYKFRTMSNARDGKGELLPDSVRLTKFGRMLRSTSLDELPEAFNILKGDMSFVGPRPLIVRYLPYYTEKERQRHGIRPGLTGLAQINGRNAINWEERFAYDLQYKNSLTFLTDMKILFRTVLKVFKREDIGERGTGPLKDFDKYRSRD